MHTDLFVIFIYCPGEYKRKNFGIPGQKARHTANAKLSVPAGPILGNCPHEYLSVSPQKNIQKRVPYSRAHIVLL